MQLKANGDLEQVGSALRVATQAVQIDGKDPPAWHLAALRPFWKSALQLTPALPTSAANAAARMVFFIVCPSIARASIAKVPRLLQR
jgi:hypothetical protein